MTNTTATHPADVPNVNEMIVIHRVFDANSPPSQHWCAAPPITTIDGSVTSPNTPG